MYTEASISTSRNCNNRKRNSGLQKFMFVNGILIQTSMVLIPSCELEHLKAQMEN